MAPRAIKGQKTFPLGDFSFLQKITLYSESTTSILLLFFLSAFSILKCLNLFYLLHCIFRESRFVGYFLLLVFIALIRPIIVTFICA